MRNTATIALFALLSPVALAQSPSLDEALAQTAKWQSETSRKPLLAVSGIVQRAPASGRREIEQKFIAFLKSDATLAGKDFICKQLSVIGSEASVPVLSAMLLDAKTADMARYALERIPGAAIDRALRDTLAKTSGKPRIGIINSLGERADPASVAALRPLALGSQPAEAAAAQSALAKIADTAAVAVLAEVYDKSSGASRAAAAEAYLQAADRLAARGNTTAALPIYRTLYAAADPGTVRAAALRGLATVGGAQSTPAVMEALRGNDLRLQAIAVVALMPNSSAQLIAEMPKLSEAAQVRILGLVSERRDASALPAFTTALKSSSKPVRLAALQGIGPLGNASVVPALTAIAAGEDADEQTAARAVLARLPGKDVDAAISAGIATGSAAASAKEKREMIRAAGERGTTASASGLLQSSRDSDKDVRRESLKALAAVAGANEISGLVALVVTPVQTDDRTEASRSLGAVLRRSNAAGIKDVLSAYSQASDSEVRTALIRVMGQSGSAEALTVLRSAMKDQDAGVKRAAILALSDWPDITTVPDLFETARTASNPAHQVLALRGAVQLIGLPNPSRPNQESAKLLVEAMSLAKQTEEKRAILALLPRYPVKDSLDLADASLKDPEVAKEAKAAVDRLKRTVR